MGSVGGRTANAEASLALTSPGERGQGQGSWQGVGRSVGPNEQKRNKRG